jgi:hypothetical protein
MLSTRHAHASEIWSDGVAIHSQGGALHGVHHVVVSVPAVQRVWVPNDHGGAYFFSVGPQNIGLNTDAINGF